jgi:MMPL family protein
VGAGNPVTIVDLVFLLNHLPQSGAVAAAGPVFRRRTDRRQALVYLLADHAVRTVNAQSASILIVLVLGAGTDYALLLAARYREELQYHRDRHDAMAAALRRAVPAIVASARRAPGRRRRQACARSRGRSRIGLAAHVSGRLPRGRRASGTHSARATSAARPETRKDSW